MSKDDAAILTHRDHYVTLDGLRGLAAIAVLLFHLSQQWTSGDLVPHAYIAVDFFFLLSGFVIAKSYESRLRQTMSFTQFLRIRLIRLYPLIFLGMLLGLADGLMKLRTGHQSAADLFLDAAAGLLLLPDIAGKIVQIFPLNPPVWSLFYELVANVAYGAIAKRLRLWLVIAVILLAGAAFIYLSYRAGDTGKGAYPADYPSGLSRVFFSFFFGILLFRLQARGMFERLPSISGIWLFLIVFLSFLPGNFADGWIYNLACIFLLYPAIIVLGARDNLPRSTLPVAAWLGRISYPLYALHYPLAVRNSYRLMHNRHGLQLAAATLVVTNLMLALAWLAAAYYDEPVRRFLTRSLRRRGPGTGMSAEPPKQPLPDTPGSPALAD